ncbi:hypothetical protein [Azospirillum argentinense]
MPDRPDWTFGRDGAEVLDLGDTVAVVLSAGSARGRRWCWMVGGGAPEHEARKVAATRDAAKIAAERHLLEHGLLTGHDVIRLAEARRQGYQYSGQ